MPYPRRTNSSFAQLIKKLRHFMGNLLRILHIKCCYDVATYINDNVQGLYWPYDLMTLKSKSKVTPKQAYVALRGPGG
jgi:hypothetical protein